MKRRESFQPHQMKQNSASVPKQQRPSAQADSATATAPGKGAQPGPRAVPAAPNPPALPPAAGRSLPQHQPCATCLPVSFLRCREEQNAA